MWYMVSDGEDEHSGRRRLPLSAMARRTWEIVGPYRWAFLPGAFLMLLTVGGELVGPLLIRRLLDEVIPSGDETGVLSTAGLYAGAYVVAMGAGYAQTVLMWRTGLETVAALRRKVFAHVLSLSLSFFDRNPPGRLMARVESDVERVLDLFSFMALSILRNVLVLVATFFVMFSANAHVASIVLAIMSPVVVGTYFLLRYVRENYRTVRAIYARISGFLAEFVQAIPVLQVYGYTDRARAKLADLNKAKVWREAKVAYVEYAAFSLIMTMEVVAAMAIIYLGSAHGTSKGLSVGTMVLFIEYTRRFFWPLVAFSEQLGAVQKSFAALDRVFAILDTEAEVRDEPGALDEVPSDWKELRFENVSFAYEEGVTAVNDVSFTVRRGERVALVGLSGGGKTTIASLLMRFYEPMQGRITLDGVDIRRFTQKAWRQRIGLVLQDVSLFPGTVAENVSAMRKGTRRDAIEHALKVVEAWDIVERLPGGLDAEISEGGGNLSMGERQLLCFARAIVQEPDLLVLDEATSSVDPVTEERLQRSLEDLMRGRTSVVIAHRLATITKCDRILVLHEGKLVEKGTHRELYELGGIYRNLFDLQFARGGFEISGRAVRWGARAAEV